MYARASMRSRPRKRGSSSSNIFWTLANEEWGLVWLEVLVVYWGDMFCEGGSAALSKPNAYIPPRKTKIRVCKRWKLPRGRFRNAQHGAG